jgi:hypothetical protein
MSSERGRFTYEVVTHNGAGVHHSYKSFPEAKIGLSKIALGYPLPGEVFELQRTRHLDRGRQYYMRRRSRWVTWNPKQKYTAREPDHLVITPEPT